MGQFSKQVYTKRSSWNGTLISWVDLVAQWESVRSTFCLDKKHLIQLPLDIVSNLINNSLLKKCSTLLLLLAIGDPCGPGAGPQLGHFRLLSATRRDLSWQ